MSENPGPPPPHAELARLNRLVGTWSMEGHLVGSDETTIRGETTFRWLFGYFLDSVSRSTSAGSRSTLSS